MTETGFPSDPSVGSTTLRWAPSSPSSERTGSPGLDSTSHSTLDVSQDQVGSLPHGDHHPTFSTAITSRQLQNSHRPASSPPRVNRPPPARHRGPKGPVAASPVLNQYAAQQVLNAEASPTRANHSRYQDSDHFFYRGPNGGPPPPPSRGKHLAGAAPDTARGQPWQPGAGADALGRARYSNVNYSYYP